MWLLYLTFFVLFGSVISVIIAMIYMNKTRRYIDSLPVITIRAEVIESSSRYGSSYELYNPYKLGNSRQSIVFLTDKDQYIKLNVSSKDYHALLPSFYGDLTYKANKMISFKRKKGHEEARLQAREEERLSKLDPSSTILFYCDAPKIQYTVPTDAPEPYTLQAVNEYINNVFEEDTDQFFGLEQGNSIIQFSSSCEDDIIIDIPDISRGGSYQGLIKNKEHLLTVIEAIYNGVRIDDILELEFVKL